jgi:4-diphosphocytidyl-2-C-methyl-D-erythritol kinase
VYAEADRLGLGRSSRALQERQLELRTAFELGAPVPAARELLGNDLQAAAISLCPQIAAVLAMAGEASAEEALVSGSGPTVLGLFARANALGRCERAAAGLAGRVPAPICASSVDAAFARAVSVAESGLDAGAA